MFAGLALWVVAFYLPYAWFTLTFNYSYGQARPVQGLVGKYMQVF